MRQEPPDRRHASTEEQRFGTEHLLCVQDGRCVVNQSSNIFHVLLFSRSACEPHGPAVLGCQIAMKFKTIDQGVVNESLCAIHSRGVIRLTDRSTIIAVDVTRGAQVIRCHVYTTLPLPSSDLCHFYARSTRKNAVVVGICLANATLKSLQVQEYREASNNFIPATAHKVQAFKGSWAVELFYINDDATSLHDRCIRVGWVISVYRGTGVFVAIANVTQEVISALRFSPVTVGRSEFVRQFF